MDFSILSKEELQNLIRMNQNLVRFAYADMVQSGFDPRAVAEPQGGGDQVLQDQRQGQREKSLVEAGSPAEMTKHGR